MAQIGNSAHIIVDDDDAMQTTSNIGHRSMGNSCRPKHAQCLTLCVAEKNVMLFLIRKWSNGNSAHIKADTTSNQRNSHQSFLMKKVDTTNFLASLGSKVLVNIYK